MNNIFLDYLEILFPARCAACQEVIPVSAVFCEECLEEIEFINQPVCRCGAEQTGLCSCEGFDFAFENNTSVLRYDLKVKQVMDNLKIHKIRYIAKQLGRLIAPSLTEENPGYTVAVAVPLHENRRKRRGFNQSEIIAAEVSKILKIRRDFTIIRRVKDTKSQRGLSATDRQVNVEGAFSADPEKVKGQVILLIDDVFTTGATMQECAAELKRAGAEAVYCATAAKTFKRSKFQ